MSLEMDHVGLKTRSLGQIVEKHMPVPRACDSNLCSSVLYHKMHQAQVSNSRVIVALLFMEIIV